MVVQGTLLSQWEKQMKVIIGVLVGAVMGYGYYKLVGCSTGACPITSNPWISTLYGGLMGFFLTQA